VAGKFEWSLVPGYILAQMIGAFLGSVLVWLHYLPHWKETQNTELKLAVFATGSAIRNFGLAAIFYTSVFAAG
jgi:glycerol uptake facilitator protein